MKVEVPNSFRYQVFESLDLDSKVETGILERSITQRPGPSPNIVPYGDLPVGTVSEIVEFKVVANGWRLVRAHQYRLPNGEVRGGPDPKYIRLDDIVIIPER